MESEKGERRRSRPLSTLRKESSAEEDVDLYNERKSSLVPLTRSPFKPIEEPEPEPKPEIKYRPDEYVVCSAELPWNDLLLELAMTTTFSSLTDGTPILDMTSVTSYLSFFGLVWWVWASQVAYNVRFRQSDWMHRAFAFFQLLIFCALAAFTNNFDVTHGILDTSAEERKIVDLQIANLASSHDVAVAWFRNKRLPTLNARGISLTMGFSRLLLLVQYLLAFYHALRHSKEVIQGERRPIRLPSFLVHIGTLAFSSLCYFTAYAVIGKQPDKGDQIAKIALWYMPFLIEVISHFVAASLPGRVRYPAQKVYERGATVFIIILGGGLDRITNGFQFVVGNVSIGFESLGLILCGVVIFALLFSLYFGTSKADTLGSRRSLAAFFIQFFYLSALIVTLQGIAAMLKVGNIGDALETPFQFVRETHGLLDSKGFGVYLNESDYGGDIQRKLNKTGVALNSLVEFVNMGVDDAFGLDDFNLTYNFLLVADMYLIGVVLTNFRSYPPDGTLLGEQMYLFLTGDPSNYTVVNNVTFNEIAEELIVTNATPALWFYAAGGVILIMLAVMNLMNRWPPRDKYEWGQTLSRLAIGSFIVAFTAINANASDDVIDENLNYEGSRIWYLATHSLVLPPYAAALLVQQLIELGLLYMAGRSYSNFRSSILWTKPPRLSMYAPAATTDPSQQYASSYGNLDGAKGMYNEPFDRRDYMYDPYEKSGHTPASQLSTPALETQQAGVITQPVASR